MSEVRPLPSNEWAEKAVISAMMHNEILYKQAISEGVDLDCFNHPCTRTLFTAIADRERGADGTIDLITLIPHLNDVGLLSNCGGPSAVTDVYTFAPYASGWAMWVNSLREMKARRLALKAAQSLIDAADSGDALETVRVACESISKAVTGHNRSSTGKQAVKAFSDIFKSTHEAGDIPGGTTGIPQLDQISGGMRPGELWVMGAKPSRGKSVLIIQFACEFIKRGLPVALFSIEMTINEIIGRIICYLSGVDYGCITQPRRASRTDLQKIKRACETIAESKIHIDATANQTMDSIEVESQRIKDINNGSLAYIGIDYLQIVRSTRSGRTREEEVAHTSSCCKQLAKHIGCPVITATQLNEQNQTRESRAIEQDADALIFICEDGLKIGKMRNGQRDLVLPLKLNGSLQRFE